MKKINLNGSDISFPQDSLLDFEEESHTYTVKGVGEMTSVSTVIKKFFNEFDALKVSLRKCDNRWYREASPIHSFHSSRTSLDLGQSYCCASSHKFYMYRPALRQAGL